MKLPLRTSRWLRSAPPGVAIEIAAGRVTVAEFAGGGASPAISAFASEPIPLEAVVPAFTGPNVAQPKIVAGALKVALDRAGLRAPRRAALVVPDSVGRVSMLRFDEVPKHAADFDQLIRLQLRKSTPFPIEEAQVSYVPANADGQATTMAATVARRDVIAEYEAVAAAVGVHAGLVDLASFNVMNALVGTGSTPSADWLLVCLTAEATTLAILRGNDLMFYRHRANVDDEPLGALVHQTAMYHEDRLGGSRFERIWLCGGTYAAGGADRVRAEISSRLDVPVETVDFRRAAMLRSRFDVTPDVLDALAAPVGVLLRERRAA
jgi:Tfp pilus assembly PilM family ATPase